MTVLTIRVYLGGLLMSRRCFLLFRMLFTVSVHHIIGLLPAVVGLFMIGYCNETDSDAGFYSFILLGRGLQGLGNGYLINFGMT
jgi:hypothetical protein